MLRFPFFALGRRGLSNRKGLDIRGRTTIDGHATDFQYRITCNSDDPYPGPLARKCHFALLDILQSTQTFPFSNPIQFTWRELMSHCGMSIGGMGVRQLKQAIRSIEGTRVRTTFALKNANDSYLKTREQGYGLYARYVFVDEHLPDATTLADRNFVWLSDWYLANLNSLYCSPLNYSLWLSLNHTSTIASRLYEFLIYNFAGDWQTQTIDYEKLASFLPVVPKNSPSQITQQLDSAFELLIRHAVLQCWTLGKGKRGQPQLTFMRGPGLSKPTSRTPRPVDPPLETAQIQDLYKNTTAEDGLVEEFYQLWTGSTPSRPTATEKSRARDVLDKYPKNAAFAMLPCAVKILRERFPAAKTFGALDRYWPEAAKLYEHDQRRSERRKEEFLRMEIEQDHQQHQEVERERLSLLWKSLPLEQQQEIREEVLRQSSPSMKLDKKPGILERFCLRELGNRNLSPPAPTL